MSTRLLLAGALLSLIGCIQSSVTAHAEGPPEQRLTAYYAQYSPDRMLEILQLSNPHISGHSSLGALAYARRISLAHTPLSWELEGQIVQHFGRQTHQEVNGVLIVRWNRFPWDPFLDTSAAFGWGQSYAFSVPELEPRSDRDEESTRLLNYLLVELDFAPARRPEWGMVLRLHHRSGIFGLYDGVSGGSNFVGIGLRYTF